MANGATPAPPPLTTIKLRGRRKRHIANTLRKLHPIKPDLSSPGGAVLVCISDTHNTKPDVPPGDVLIHAGDLTENGSFDEVQAGLRWLSSQPHTYKILIAGNHDVLLDESFLERYPGRRYGQSKTKEDLDWGTVIYLQDSSITLEFPPRESPAESGDNAAQPPTCPSYKLTVFGTPWTPQYGISAFQYRPDDGEDHWATRFASLGNRRLDILVTHGPPKHHLDARDFRRAGCPYLAAEIARIRPRLVVFGHIHASYGREDVVLDGVQKGFEEVMAGWAGWGRLALMAWLVLWARLASLFHAFGHGERIKSRITTFVNAAVVSGPRNELSNEAIVVKL